MPENDDETVTQADVTETPDDEQIPNDGAAPQADDPGDNAEASGNDGE